MPDVAAPPAAAIDGVRDLLAATVASSDLSDAERARAIRRLRDDLSELVGQADRYLGDTDLAREASASSRQARLAEAYENAGVREQALKRGLASEPELDALGYFSRDDLDRMAEDGTLWESLDEAAFGLGRLHGDALNRAVKRDHGQFSTMNVAGTGQVRGAPRGVPKATPQGPGGSNGTGRADATRAARTASRGGPPTPVARPGVGAPGAPEALGAPGPDNVHDVGADVNKAADLLSAGHHVKLDQPQTASVLLGELHRRVQEAKAAGGDAPNFDLCKVTVKGTNLFCAESKGIPRVKMPQLGGTPMPGSLADKLPKNEHGKVDLAREFRKRLGEMGHKTTRETVPASHLKASQIELNGGKVAGMVKHLEGGGKFGGKDDHIFTSSDNYIVDGHHRWAATVGHSLGEKGQDLGVPVEKVDMPITDLLHHANTFAHEMGVPQAAVGGATGPPEPTDSERSQLEKGDLPERGELYFHTNPQRLVSKYGPVAVEDVPLDKITPIRARPEGIANAKPLMAKAGLNEGGKRDPITLVRQPDGSFKVHDGNSTFAIASEAGWKSVPAMVVDSEAQGQRIEAIAKQVKREQKVQAKRIETETAMHGMIREDETSVPDQNFATVDDMFAAAAADFPAFRELLTGEGGLASLIGAGVPDHPDKATEAAKSTPDQPQVFFGPLKKKERAMQKIDGKYGGDHNRLKDVIRGTVVVPDLKSMPDMFAQLRTVAEQHGWTIAEAENRFLDPPPPPPGATGGTPLGYRDAKVALVSPNGVAAELQLNTSAMVLAKNGEGHTLYEEQRELEHQIKTRAKSSEGATPARPAGPTRAERKRLRELEDASRKLYADAFINSYG